MGLLDELLGGGNAASQGSGGDPSALIRAALGALAGGGSGRGGMDALAQAFQGQGMGDLLASWIGTGSNQPVSAEQMKRGLGPDLLSQMASKAGMDQDAAASGLAGLLPELIDKLSPNGNAPNSGLLQALLALLAGGGQGTGGGGLQALIRMFTQGGLGDLVSSWIGTGANLPVTPDQVRRGLGPDLLSQLAAKAGMAPDAAASGLSELLPGLVDSLTPQGKAPDFDRLLQGMDFSR